MDRERVSLSLKATQEDPWQHFARTHAIGQVVPGQGHQAGPVRCVRPRRRRHRGPGPHLRAGRAPRGDPGAGRPGRRRHLRQGHRHRPRASPHLAVAQAGQRRERARSPSSTRRSTAWRRSTTRPGNYKYPEGFDPETNEWLEGFETQREKWEKQYAEAHARWEAHKKQVEEATKADAEAAANGGASTSYSSDSGSSVRRRPTATRAAAQQPPGRGGRGHAGLRRGARRSAREAHRQLSRTTRHTSVCRVAGTVRVSQREARSPSWGPGLCVHAPALLATSAAPAARNRGLVGHTWPEVHWSYHSGHSCRNGVLKSALRAAPLARRRGRVARPVTRIHYAAYSRRG